MLYKAHNPTLFLPILPPIDGTAVSVNRERAAPRGRVARRGPLSKRYTGILLMPAKPSPWNEQRKLLPQADSRGAAAIGGCASEWPGSDPFRGIAAPAHDR